MNSGTLVAPVDEILADPRFFPVQVDFQRKCMTLVETSRERLANAPFLDGRVPIADGIALELSLADAFSAQWSPSTGPDRFIFHVAFCGSTLLSTVLEVPGRSFAEREPNVLVDVANATGAHSPGLVRPALDLMRALLRRTWSREEVSICKPSNWANNLIPLLTNPPDAIRPLFITTDQRSYLQALFRGGRERMVYVVHATEHLLKHRGDGMHLWNRATLEVDDPLERVARIALVSLHVQLQLFEQAMLRGGWGRSQLLTLEWIEDDPLGACQVARTALALDIPDEALERSVAERVCRYAKNPARPFSLEWERAQNRQIENNYGRILDRALDWAALGGLKSDHDLTSSRYRPAALRA